MAINLSSIVENSIKPPRIIIHGESGIGKTTFASSAPNPVFILTENGLGNIKAKSFPIAKSYQDVIDSIKTLKNENHEYETLVIDSLDWLEPLIWKHVCETWTTPTGDRKRLSSIEDAGFGKGYVEAIGYWREFFKEIDDLRDLKNMIIIMTAHTVKVKIEDPTLSASYDRNCLNLCRRPNANVEELAKQYSDVILYAQLDTGVTAVNSRDKKDKSRAISSGKIILHTIGHPAYSAKNRYNMTSPIPFPQENGWDCFYYYMNGEDKVGAAI